MEGIGTGSGAPDLFAKIGPLPAWAWGAIAVGGYLFWSHNQSATTPAADSGAVDTTDVTDTSAVPDVTTTDDYGYNTPVDPSSAGYDYGTVNDGSYSGTTSGTAYSSNQAWAVAAIETLIHSGVPASTATSGITHYLSGATLTPDEANAVNLAITLMGPAPLPMPVNVASTVPATQPPVATVPVSTPAPTPDPAPVPVVSTTPSAPTGSGSYAPVTVSGTTFTPPTYASTSVGSRNPYIASDGVSLTGTAVAMVMAKLAAHGIKTSTSYPGTNGWEQWAPNLSIFNGRTTASNTVDILAPYRSALATIVSPYSSASSAQSAMASL